MKSRTLLTLSLAVGFLSPAVGLLTATRCGAEPLPVAADKQVKPAPELDPASQRVEQARIKLEQARQQLTASRAMVRAAEAEFRAARADREALSARNTAQKLADASGLKDDGVLPVQPTAAMGSTGTRLYPVATPVAPVPATDLSSTRIQQVDFNAPQATPAAAPVADLRPNKVAEEQQPNQIP